mmetsp:Transcript_6690/g.19450  ORF Transcript_6690/g.19450 Transcript_6690/m.19450 type:complete len:245 (-) Transcript_6690:40-774(-)
MRAGWVMVLLAPLRGPRSLSFRLRLPRRHCRRRSRSHRRRSRRRRRGLSSRVAFDPCGLPPLWCQRQGAVGYDGRRRVGYRPAAQSRASAALLLVRRAARPRASARGAPLRARRAGRVLSSLLSGTVNAHAFGHRHGSAGRRVPRPHLPRPRPRGLQKQFDYGHGLAVGHRRRAPLQRALALSVVPAADGAVPGASRQRDVRVRGGGRELCDSESACCRARRLGPRAHLRCVLRAVRVPCVRRL